MDTETQKSPEVTKALELIDQAVSILQETQDPKYEEAVKHLQMAKDSCSKEEYSEEEKSTMEDVGGMKKEAEKKGKGFMDRIME